MSEIYSIVYTPANVERHPQDFYARAPLQEATLTVKRGIEGDLAQDMRLAIPGLETADLQHHAVSAA